MCETKRLLEVVSKSQHERQRHLQTTSPRSPEASNERGKWKTKKKWRGYIQLGLISQGNKAKPVKKAIASLLVLAMKACASLHAADSAGIRRFSCTLEGDIKICINFDKKQRIAKC